VGLKINWETKVLFHQKAGKRKSITSSLNLISDFHLPLQNLKTEAFVISTTTVSTTASQAGDPSPGSADARVTLSTTRATELIATPHAPTNKGKLVGALLIRNPKIAAGLAPLHAVRREFATPISVLSEQVSQFMKQGFLDFIL
jgi:hypothetical protein